MQGAVGFQGINLFVLWQGILLGKADCRDLRLEGVEPRLEGANRAHAAHGQLGADTRALVRLADGLAQLGPAASGDRRRAARLQAGAGVAPPK
jgi:hypothetical protein